MITKIYIEWGGQYDCRELELIEYKGRFSWDDRTGGYMTIHNELPQAFRSTREAKRALASFVFRLGEPDSFIEFGDDTGVLRAKDPYGWFPIPGERGYQFFAV